mmetsp:Transcript_9282/g.24532  ORF Transcript_9282/g.24532 Transcript_9282/m.24532 type:complete len:358 (-) Transcript_9282:800-1873(-)
MVMVSESAVSEPTSLSRPCAAATASTPRQRLVKAWTRTQLFSDEGAEPVSLSSLGSYGPRSATFDSRAELNQDFPVHVAAAAGDVEELRRLCERGAQVNTPGHRGRRALHCAVENGHSDAVELLVLRFRANVELKDAFARTALHVAARGSDAKLVALLINFGARKTAQDENGDTPLHLAVRAARLGAVRALLSGADECGGSEMLQMKNKQGLSALQCAMKLKSAHSAELVSSLLAAGAELPCEKKAVQPTTAEALLSPSLSPPSSPRVKSKMSKLKLRKARPAVLVVSQLFSAETESASWPASARTSSYENVAGRADGGVGSTPRTAAAKIRELLSRSPLASPRTPKVRNKSVTSLA